PRLAPCSPAPLRVAAPFPTRRSSDLARAHEMLRSLSGRSHVVMTAFAIKTHKQIRVQRVNTTVFFRPLTRKEIEWYWQTGEQSEDRKSTRLNSSHVKTSYAVFCLKSK